MQMSTAGGSGCEFPPAETRRRALGLPTQALRPYLCALGLGSTLVADVSHAALERPPQLIAIAFDNCMELERWNEIEQFLQAMNAEQSRTHFTFFVSGTESGKGQENIRDRASAPDMRGSTLADRRAMSKRASATSIACTLPAMKSLRTRSAILTADVAARAGPSRSGPASLRASTRSSTTSPPTTP